MTHLSISCCCKDCIRKFSHLKLTRFLDITELGDKSGEAVFKAVCKVDFLPMEMTDLITSYLSILLKRLIEFMNDHTRNITGAIWHLRAITSVRAGVVEVHIHASSLFVTDEHRVLSTSVICIYRCISFIDRHERAFSHRDFAILQGYESEDVIIGKVIDISLPHRNIHICTFQDVVRGNFADGVTHRFIGSLCHNCSRSVDSDLRKTLEFIICISSGQEFETILSICTHHVRGQVIVFIIDDSCSLLIIKNLEVTSLSIFPVAHDDSLYDSIIRKGISVDCGNLAELLSGKDCTDLIVSLCL